MSGWGMFENECSAVGSRGVDEPGSRLRDKGEVPPMVPTPEELGI